MLVSHEVPMVLLNESRTFNDYDYALVHMFEKYPEYYNFFVESLNLGRTVILDNSVFELGESFNIDDYIKWIDKLKPTEFIIPDSLDNIEITVNNISNFASKKFYNKSIKIGVVQGKTHKEMIDCYDHHLHSKNIDKIAIPFHSASYPNITDNKFYNEMMGRVNFMKIIFQKFHNKKKLHLLGIALPNELAHYKKFKSKSKIIESIDTSNPIVHGLHNIKYDEYGLNEKLSIKLVDLFETKIEQNQMDCIKFNVERFKLLSKLY